MMSRWKYLTIDELLACDEAVWLFYKRWDGGVLIPTAIRDINRNDDGEAYSIRFFSGNVQIVKGYGVYWWATDRKPDQKRQSAHSPAGRMRNRWNGWISRKAFKATSNP